MHLPDPLPALTPDLPTGPCRVNAIRTTLPGIELTHEIVDLVPGPDWPSTLGANDLCFVTVIERHGRAGNVAHGLNQIAISPAAKAERVAGTLADHDITAVFASPLQRAQETATPIAASHGLPIITDEELIEAGNQFEGLKVAVGDGALRQPKHWAKLRDPFTPSWGEPYIQLAHRMLAGAGRANVVAYRLEGQPTLPCLAHGFMPNYCAPNKWEMTIRHW